MNKERHWRTRAAALDEVIEWHTVFAAVHFGR